MIKLNEIQSCNTLQSFAFIVIALTLQIGVTSAESSDQPLIDVKIKLKDLKYHYGKPRVIDANPGSEFLPNEELRRYEYPSGNLELAKIDYYTLPSWFTKEEHLATEIYIYNTKQTHLDYTVWLDDKNRITQFQKYIPLEVIAKNRKTGIEVKIRKELNYDGNGKLLKRIEIKYTLNHKDLSALYLINEYDISGKILATETGGYDYDNLACPADNRHCN